ncbi:MAG: NUDIX hydrolase [Pyrobaculum sp.]
MDRPAVAVAAVAVKNGEVVLVKRKYPPNPGKWSLPGGRVELGERLEEAVLRELREETGLTGRVVKFLQPVEYIEREGPRVNYHFIILVYLVEVEGDASPTASDDAEDVAVVPVGKALEMDLTKTTREVLEKLLSKF